MFRPNQKTARASERGTARLAGILGCLLCAILGIGLGVFDRTASIDEQLRIAREGLVAQRASGTIHIIEIDATSIAALTAWPWPRDVHARLIDKLRTAGAKTIAFDVDFSAPSNPAADAAFASALERAGGAVILPTFRQKTREGAQFIENVPIAPFRRHSFLASVNVHPDADGMMRAFTYGTVTQGTVRPAMPALLAGVPGRIGESFPINTAIDPDSVPRHSVSQVLSGKVPPSAFSGKIIIIGATAIELGDRYAMPRHGIQPGVVIQALAAETLLQGLALPNYGAGGPILLGFLLLVLIARTHRHEGTLGSAAIAAMLAMPLVLEWFGIGTVDVAAAAIAMGAGLAVIVVGNAAARYDALRLIEPATGLSNQRALLRHLRECAPHFLIVMRIRNYDDIAELMSEDQRSSLVDQVCDRIGLAGGSSEIFSLGNGRLAWTDDRADLDQLTEALEGLSALFSARISVGGKSIIIAPAFGVAIDHDCLDPAHADLAAARAAASGCCWFVYSSELGSSAGRAQQLLADLGDAMAARDISMVFQPKLNLSTRRIHGVEALVRWHHPTLGQIPPDQFIPVFEESGHMTELTLFIFDRCAETCRRWSGLGLKTSIAINISAPLFADQVFVAALFARVDMLGPLARLLVIEITESAVVLDDGPMIEALKALRARGLLIAIDDYGTGQSTLSYLKKFPVDEIKIDQSFIRQLTKEASDQILVRSTIAMAHELNFKVTAEGVEDEASLEMLAGFGCDFVQGWHIGRGVKAEEIEPRLLDYANGLLAA